MSIKMEVEEEGVVYIKKEGEEEDIKREEGNTPLPSMRRTPSSKAGIDVATGMSRINGGMSSLVTQYNQMNLSWRHDGRPYNPFVVMEFFDQNAH